MISDKPKTSSLERRKTFDSPLANHFSAVMQKSLRVRRGAPFSFQQLLQEDPQPPPAARLDVSLKPAPLPDSMKSTLIGLTSSKSFLSTRKVIPLSVNTSSFPCDSSRAIPSEGPPHPACMSIRMEGASVRLFRYSLIISLAFSVTSNIFSSLCGGAGGASPVNMAYKYARRCVLSMCIFPCFPAFSMNPDYYAAVKADFQKVHILGQKTNEKRGWK
jgi:hypothetical protein